MEDSGTKNADGMKNMFKFFAAAFAIVAAASCTKENPSTDSQVSDQKLVHKVFTATLDSDTKTTLVPGEDGSFVHWVEGDQIKVIPEGQTNATLFDILSIDGTHANFAGEIVEANSYRAVYPASALHVAKSFNEFLLTDEYSNALALQYAVENDFSVAASFGAPSNFAVSSSCSNNRLEFCNINAYLKINLAMDNASEIEISASRVTGFQNGSLSGSRGLGGALSYIVDEKFTYISSGTQSIVFKNENGSNLKQGVDYYIAIPAVEIENLKMVVKDSNGNQITSFKRSKTLLAKANTIYQLGTIAPPEPVKVGDYFYYDGTYSTELDNSKEVVGVVFFVGNPKEKFNDPDLPDQYCNGLAIGTKNVVTTWGGSSSFTVPLGVKTSPANFGKGGYSAKKIITDAGKNLPIYNNSSYSDLSLCNTSGWYIGTNKEWDYILSVKNDINTLLEAAGCDLIQFATQSGNSAAIWLPLLSGNKVYLAYTDYYGNTMQYGTNDSAWYYSSTRVARPIFAF